MIKFKPNPVPAKQVGMLLNIKLTLLFVTRNYVSNK